MECVSGIVGRYFDSRTGVASKERAASAHQFLEWDEMRAGLTDFVRQSGEMVGDGVLDDFEQLLGSVDGSNRKSVQKLYCQIGSIRSVRAQIDVMPTDPLIHRSA